MSLIIISLSAVIIFVIVNSQIFVFNFNRHRIEGSDEKIVPIGFDLEWPFSFQTGSGKTALAQICLSEELCYLFHIYDMNKLPSSFIMLLSHPKVKLVGVNIKK